MKREPSRPVFLLSVLIVFLMILQSGIGVIFPAVYRDNLFVRSAWFGNDWVTLAVAAPLFIAALARARRGSWRWYLVWQGMLAYCLYNYAFYLFGARFNSLFLVFASIFALSILALIQGLSALDIQGVATSMPRGTRLKWVSGFMVLCGGFLGFFWTMMSMSYVLTGEVPAMVRLTEHPTNVTGALDLAIMVPGFLIGAAWLWKERPWGYVLGVIMNVKGAIYTFGLALSSVVAARAGVTGVSAEIPLWLELSLGSLVCLSLLFRRSQRTGAGTQ